ncbi:hypothetical protein [Haloarcula amylolytica]|uniref:hypothetical protein n=1 Tax=Haloarcula amylolytica TaxID=396317 RepID=UPI00126746BE|nr:hypothetical protein [Haloarcula amylolytica]
MLRRNFLILSSSTFVYLSGCSSSSNNTSTPTAMTDAPQNSQEQYLEIRNRTENRESISLKIEDSDSILMEGDYMIGADQTVYLPLQITAEGKYELTVSRSGDTEVQTLVIGEYELEQGPNVVIELRGEKIEIFQLE